MKISLYIFSYNYFITYIVAQYQIILIFQPGSEVLQVLASDSDSGNFGTVFFELATDTDPVARQYFKVEKLHLLMAIGNIFLVVEFQ